MFVFLRISNSDSSCVHTLSFTKFLFHGIYIAGVGGESGLPGEAWLTSLRKQADWEKSRDIPGPLCSKGKASQGEEGVQRHGQGGWDTRWREDNCAAGRQSEGGLEYWEEANLVKAFCEQQVALASF